MGSRGLQVFRRAAVSTSVTTMTRKDNPVHARPLISIVAAILGTLVLAANAAAGAPTNPKHFFWAHGQAAPDGTVASVANDIVFHGGNIGDGAIGVQTTPAVYLVYWGPEWAKGFTTTDANGKSFSSKTLQSYLNTFMGNVGGSRWAAVQSQYCRNVPAGATTCQGVKGAQY